MNLISVFLVWSSTFVLGLRSNNYKPLFLFSSANEDFRQYFYLFKFWRSHVCQTHFLPRRSLKNDLTFSLGLVFLLIPTVITIAASCPKVRVKKQRNKVIPSFSVCKTTRFNSWPLISLQSYTRRFRVSTYRFKILWTDELSSRPLRANIRLLTNRNSFVKNTLKRNVMCTETCCISRILFEWCSLELVQLFAY